MTSTAPDTTFRPTLLAHLVAPVVPAIAWIIHMLAEAEGRIAPDRRGIALLFLVIFTLIFVAPLFLQRARIGNGVLYLRKPFVVHRIPLNRIQNVAHTAREGNETPQRKLELAILDDDGSVRFIEGPTYLAARGKMLRDALSEVVTTRREARDALRDDIDAGREVPPVRRSLNVGLMSGPAWIMMVGLLAAILLNRDLSGLGEIMARLGTALQALFSSS